MERIYLLNDSHGNTHITSRKYCKVDDAHNYSIIIKYIVISRCKNMSSSGLPLYYNAKESHEYLLNDCYGVDPSTLNPLDPKRESTASRQNAKTQDLHQVSLRLKDSIDLLQEHAANLSTDASKTSKLNSQKVLNRTVVPFLQVASTICNSAANIVSPIASGGYVHRREEVRRKKELCSANGKKPSNIALVNDFVARQVSPTNIAETPSQHATITPRKSTRKRKAPALPKRDVPDPPVPANGSEYGVGEFLHVISRYRKGTWPRGKLMKKIFDEKKYVKRHRSAAYRHMAASERGKVYAFNAPWPENGREAIMNETRLEECAKEIRENPGEKLMEKNIQQMLFDSMKQKGYAPDPDMKFNSQTVRNYYAMLANRAGLSLVDKSIEKTSNRWTVEHSIIGTMDLIVVIAMTHFYVVEYDDPEWHQYLKTIPKETRLLYDLVCLFYGNKPVRPRPGHLIFNQDCTTDFICRGTQPDKNSKLGLVATSSLHASGHLSIYHQEDSNKMNGTRCKRHLIINGMGDVAPAVFSFAGLSEWEMQQDAFIVMRIEGLCVRGYGAHRSTGVGWVLFMRKGEGAEKKRFEWIREHILFPFIDWCRKKYDNFDKSLGVPLSEDLRAISWVDGDNSQINTIISEEGIASYAKNLVTVNKHNAGGSGKEQACDKCDVFPVSKQLNKKMTVVHIPSARHLLKGNIEEAFSNESHRLRPKKKPEMVDYLAKQPKILTQSCVQEKAQKGFIVTGMLDSKTQRMPVLHRLVSTCRRIPTDDEMDLVAKSVAPLMHYSYGNGTMKHIPDEVFIGLGFRSDRDPRGNEKVNKATISQENQQRAKCLTAPAEIAARKQRDDELELDQKRKDNQAKAAEDLKRTQDQAMIDQLCALSNLESSEDNVAKCELGHFGGFKAGDLRNFILARSAMTATQISKLKRPAGRKALEEAKAGVKNCVWHAFNVRGEKSKFLAVVGTGDEAATEVNAPPPAISPYIIDVPLYRDESWIKPSAILDDTSKIELLASAFDPQGKLNKVDDLKVRPWSPSTAKLAQKADLLFAMLQMRCRSHIKRKVMPAQRSYYCLPWAMKNLAVVAAYMVYFDHLKIDISCLDESRCLLAKPSQNVFLLVSNIEGTNFGCYLFFDTNGEVFIRSGSAAGDKGMVGRVEEHKKRAEMEQVDDGSRLYITWPSMKTLRSKSCAKDGLFEYLVAYVGVAFGRDVVESGVLSKDFNDGGIFFHSQKDLARIRTANFSGAATEEYKFLRMVAYLFELGYDVALGRKDNVSDSPGFEACGLKRWRPELEG